MIIATPVGDVKEVTKSEYKINNFFTKNKNYTSL